MRYRVDAHREGEWWALEFPDVDDRIHSQARTLDEIPAIAADALTLWFEDDDARTVTANQIDIVLPEQVRTSRSDLLYHLQLLVAEGSALHELLVGSRDLLPDGTWRQWGSFDVRDTVAALSCWIDAGLVTIVEFGADRNDHPIDEAEQRAIAATPEEWRYDSRSRQLELRYTDLGRAHQWHWHEVAPPLFES